VNSVTRLRSQIKIALVIESFRGSNEIPELTQLAQKYAIQGEDELIRSSIRDWEDAGYLIVARDLSGYVGACLKRASVSDSLEEVLEILEADTFKVDWAKEEIVTDALRLELIPGLEGWKLFEIARKAEQSQSADHDVREQLAPIQINNSFSPVNNAAPQVESEATTSRNWAGWAAVLVGVIAIVISLWIGGKLP